MFDLVRTTFSPKNLPEARIVKTRKSKMKFFADLLVNKTKFLSTASSPSDKQVSQHKSMKSKLGSLFSAITPGHAPKAPKEGSLKSSQQESAGGEEKQDNPPNPAAATKPEKLTKFVIH